MSISRKKSLTASQSEWLRVICTCALMNYYVATFIIHATPLKQLKAYGLIQVFELEGAHFVRPTADGWNVYHDQKVSEKISEILESS